MNLMEIYAHIQEAQENKYTYEDLKKVIFWDDLRDCELYEIVTISVFHNFDLAKDTMARLGKSIQDLHHEIRKWIETWPSSYQGEDEEWALWDIMDGWVMELLGRDKRICKRAGW